MSPNRVLQMQCFCQRLYNRITYQLTHVEDMSEIMIDNLINGHRGVRYFVELFSNFTCVEKVREMVYGVEDILKLVNCAGSDPDDYEDKKRALEQCVKLFEFDRQFDCRGVPEA